MTEERHAYAVIIDETVTYSLRELCESCGVHAERVIEMVDYGIVEPLGGSPERWQFHGESVFRIRKAVNLCEDLGLNLAGASLALELLDELEQLRRELQHNMRRSVD